MCVGERKTTQSRMRHRNTELNRDENHGRIGGGWRKGKNLDRY
jgi:hypothetical protein